jgi:hypothetical protein
MATPGRLGLFQLLTQTFGKHLRLSMLFDTVFMTHAINTRRGAAVSLFSAENEN